MGLFEDGRHALDNMGVSMLVSLPLVPLCDCHLKICYLYPDDDDDASNEEAEKKESAVRVFRYFFKSTTHSVLKY